MTICSLFAIPFRSSAPARLQLLGPPLPGRKRPDRSFSRGGTVGLPSTVCDPELSHHYVLCSFPVHCPCTLETRKAWHSAYPGRLSPTPPGSEQITAAGVGARAVPQTGADVRRRRSSADAGVRASWPRRRWRCGGAHVAPRHDRYWTSVCHDFLSPRRVPEQRSATNRRLPGIA